MGELDAEEPRLRHQVVSNAGGRVVVELGGELDMETVEALGSTLDGAVAPRPSSSCSTSST